jgi:hypothetical protein
MIDSESIGDFTTSEMLCKQASAIDIAIIGAGPQALTLVAHLLQKRQQLKSRIRVFDPSGKWLTHWQQQFAQLEIPHLRSPIVHHPEPDAYGLRRFAQNRQSELYPPYDLPGTQVFNDFCCQVVQSRQLQNMVTAQGVRGLEARAQGWQLTLDNGAVVSARRVVMANGGGQAALPAWCQAIPDVYPADRLQHSSRVDLRSLRCAGEHILIVGSGLTSGHLAIGAARRGAKVTMLARRSFYAKLFDADPGWLGPKYLKEFRAEVCWQQRWQAIATARNGGSLTPTIMAEIRRLVTDGRIQMVDNCEIQQARWRSIGSGWQLTCTLGQQLYCDRLWLSTGSTLGVEQHSLLKTVADQYPIPIVSGLPVLTNHLRWGDRELYVMGGLAALQIGPTARNLAGARMASDKIVDALVKPRTHQALVG